MAAIHEMEAQAPGSVAKPGLHGEFVEAMDGMPIVYARVQKPINFARIERPGDDRMEVRQAEVGEVGDLVGIPLDLPVSKAQTPIDVAFLFCIGDIAPISQDEFNKSEPYVKVVEKREKAEAAEAKKRSDDIAALEARIAALESPAKK